MIIVLEISLYCKVNIIIQNLIGESSKIDECWINLEAKNSAQRAEFWEQWKEVKSNK